jgi:hypothetical protein
VRLAVWALLQARFPAVVHLDGTGRVQTVSASDNAWLYALLKERRECRTAARMLFASIHLWHACVACRLLSIACSTLWCVACLARAE